MTNLTNNLQRTISKTLELLDETNLNQKIYIRFDAAINQFRVKPNVPFSHKVFHNTISEFVQHVYEYGLRIPRKLSFSQAHAEAIAILEKYQNAYSSGYDAAILDAANPDLNGIELIISNMAEIVKEREKDKYIRWIILKHIDSLDWEPKTKIIELLLKEFRHFLPQNILECDPAQLVDDYQTLIFNQISTDKILHKVNSLSLSLFF